jgi:MFS family permease
MSFIVEVTISGSQASPNYGREHPVAATHILSTSYTVALAALLLIGGALGDRLGRRPALVSLSVVEV